MPRIAVIAGINGAGKTTASQRVLHDELKMPCFVNADAIARGLNGFDLTAEAAKAGRVMLEHMHELADRRADFSFETTLAGRAYASWLAGLRTTGYQVLLYYYWLNSPDLAIRRVAQRVQAGGHFVPDATVRQRYSRSVRNFLTLFRPIVDYWELYDNTLGDRVLIGMGDPDETLIGDEDRWDAFQRSAES